MDRTQEERTNQAAQEWTKAARQSFQTLADQTVRLQEGNLWFTQNLFQQFVEELQRRLQSGQALQQQAENQQQAFETLAEESANAYSDFLNSALSFYQQTLQQTAGQVAQSGVQAASQAAQQAALGSGRAPRRVVASAAGSEVGRPVPISGPTAWTDDEPTPSKYRAPDHATAVQIIDELLSEDSSYDEETWPEIAEALDRDRPSHRKLFVA